MLSLATALKEFEAEDRTGHRKPAEIVFCTADRELWNKYLNLSKQLKSLTAGSDEYIKLQNKINSIAGEMGGRFIKIKQCVQTGRPGKGPSKAEIARAELHNDLIKDPRHYNNKTRNVEILSNREKRKFHIKLLMQKDRVKVIH